MSFTESENVSVVNELSSKKSTDHIGLNKEIIKYVIANTAKPLYYIIINLSWIVDFQII